MYKSTAGWEKLNAARVAGFASLTMRGSTHWSRYLTAFAAVGLISLGAVVTFGWIVGAEALIQVLPNMLPMTRNTAACFLVGGLALLVLALNGPRAPVVVAAALVGVVGTLSLIHHLFGISTGIANILGPPYVPVTSTGAGMALISSIAFVIGAIGLAAAPWRADERAKMVLGIAGSMVVACGIAGLTAAGILSGARGLAPHSVIGFCVFGAGLLALGWRSDADRAATPRWLPIAIVISIFSGVLGLWRTLVAGGLEPFSLLPIVVLTSGVVMGLSFGLAVYLAQRGFAQAAALRRAEAEARQIIDNIPSLITLFAPDGTVEVINSRIFDFTGKTREELVRWGASDLVHPDDLEGSIEASRAGLASGKTYTIVYRMRRHDGPYRWFEAVHTPLMDEQGQLYRWCVSVTDIDDRKRLEETLRESARSARSTIDGIPGLVASLDGTGGVTFVNRQISEYTGCTLEELKEWGTNGIVHPEDMPHVADIFLKAIADGTPYLIEQRIRRFDGAYRWFDNRGLPIRDDSGVLAGWYVLMADIHDRKQAQDALRESEHHLRSLVDGMPGLVASLTRDGAVESANRRLLDYIGLPFEDLQNWGTNGIVHLDDLPHVGAAFMGSMASGEPYEYEHRLRGGDGTYRWFSDRGIPVLDETGRVARWYVLITDIDDHVRARSALAESEKRSRQIVDSIPGLIAVFSSRGELEFMNRPLLEFGRRGLDLNREWQFNDSVHPKDLPGLLDNFARGLAGGEPFEVEVRCRRDDGVYRWFNSRAFPHRDDSGLVTNWYNLLVDIDDQKRAQEALAASERELRLIVDGVVGMIALFSPDGQLNGSNQQLLDYFQQPLEEVMNWATNGMTHPDDLQPTIDSFTSALASGEPYEFETRFMRFDGVFRWFQIRGRPLRDDNGRIVRWYGLLSDIDDRKRAEEALAASERESRLIVDSIEAMISLFSPDGEMNGGNQQMLDYFGKPLVEVKKWATNGITHPQDVQHVIDSFMAAVVSGDPYDFETRLLRHDGVFRWFQIRGRPLRNADGQIIRWYGLLNDIDDRKRAEEALAASERNLQLTVDSIPALAWTTRPDGWTEFVNQAYREFAGVPLEKLQGNAWTVLVHRDDLPGLMETWSGMLQSGLSGEVEIRFRRHDGEYRWFLIRANPLRDENGTIIKWYGINFDIEDRKRAEAELRRAYDSFADAQRLSHTGSFITDLVGDDHNWSDETYRIFEFEPDSQVSLERIQALIHPDDLPSFGAMIARAMQGANVDFGFRIITPAGATKHIRGLAHVVEQVSGRPMFVGALQDATKAVLAEEALDRTRSELAHVTRVSALSTLTASIAHEVSQPLSGIITNASTSLRMLSLSVPDVHGALETARRTIRDGNRAADVIARLRAMFGKVQTTTFEEVALNDAARDVAALSRVELQHSGISLHWELAENLPLVMADRVQIQQVILNLLLNAMEAMVDIDDGPRRATIKTEEDSAGNVQLTVRDTGIGIDPNVASRLFDAFFTSKDAGMGIGLSVSRSIIERHNGTISAAPNNGPGASFTFTLPRSSAGNVHTDQLGAAGTMNLENYT